MARPWSARCYGVARQREGSRPALTWFISLTRAGALMARPWSARCYGVARQREGSRQNSIGAGSLDPLARGCRRIWPARCCSTGSGRLDLDLWFRPARCCSTGSGRLDLDLWFRPARCCSTGSGRLDLDLLISGPRVTLVYQPYARGGADGQAVVCPLLRGSSPTRGVAPKQHRGLRRAFSPAFFGLVLLIPLSLIHL